ncbi:saccharopine dehydrogenase family protein [Hydrogenophaga sp. A37]|uniref:saccharopine dehydrogenase family protein n=1 Tax=Hydrogenophaga sp. A37 TaxID=1945864 RepID=UPI00098594B5|nr:saccharopine dehydrogenase NADP-binding domain-containing protein [Hydrogenophaga sp. A37]OOG86719.1 saccharopine dehydrogenase [Hydrogenophaga sp. A37]
MPQTLTHPPLNVLVLGGYGNFGTRIVQALANDPGIQLLIGGRNEARSKALAQQTGSAAQAMVIDATDANLAARLKAAKVGLVIHTAGPFQAQGYTVAEACADASAHYIDLADGRRFVCDFPAAMQARFAAAHRCAVSGASTVPALSSAVVDHLTQGWQAIHSIYVCIAPAQTAPRGVATLASVLSYCGTPVDIWREGRWQQALGWADPVPVRFPRMQPRRAALCDIPDLELFPVHYQVKEAVVFRAALEVPLSQTAFAWLAALRHWGLLPRPQALAPWLLRGAPLFDRWGSALGGMYVQVAGLDAQGQHADTRWDIAADHDHGPQIPCMAAILLARRLACGDGPAPGAHTATGLLALDDFTPEFARWGMVTDTD